MSQQKTPHVQASQKTERVISISSVDEECLDESHLLKKNETTKKRNSPVEDSFDKKSLKTAWDSVEIQTHKLAAEDMVDSADGIAKSLNWMSIKPPSSHYRNHTKTCNAKRRETLDITPKKKKRHGSVRGHFYTPVKSPRRWSLISRSEGKHTWDTTSQIMSTIYGIKDKRREKSKVAVSHNVDPAQIATHLLLKQSKEKQSKEQLGINLFQLMQRENGASLFKEKIRSLASDGLRAITCELFSNVKRSNALMKVACSVNRENSDKRNTMEIIIEKTHEMVECSGVCLYLLDTKSRLIIALTDDSAIFVDARLSWRSLVGRCAFTNEVVKKCGQMEHHDLPEFKTTVELPRSVMFVPIHGTDVEVMGVLGVFDSPKHFGFDNEDESLVTFVSSLAGYTLVNMLEFEKQAHKSEQVEYLMKSISRMESHMEQGPQNTIAELVELSYELFHCERIAFFEIDGDEVLCTVSRDFVDGRLPKNKGLIGHVVETGEIVNIPDAYKDPRFNKSVDVKTLFHTTSILAAPVFDESSKVIGVIQCINKRQPQGTFSDPLGIANTTYNIKRENVDAHMPRFPKRSNTDVISDGILEVPEMETCSEYQLSPKPKRKVRNRYSYHRSSSFFTKKETVPFPEADELLIKTLAKSAGVVIVKARLFHKLVMAQRKNKALIHVLHVTSTDMDLPDMLDEIANATCEIIRANRISIFLVDKDEKRLCSIVSKDSEMMNLCVPLGQGIVGSCFMSKMTIRVDNPYKDPRFLKEIDRATGFVTSSVLAVPIADAHGNYVGVLQALNKKDNHCFSKEDEDLLVSISKEVGESIRRGLLMLDTKTRELLLAEKAQYPWQSAMMRIYSGKYTLGLPRAAPIAKRMRSDASTSMSNKTTEIDLSHTNTELGPYSSTMCAEILESLDTCKFDVLNYDEMTLNDMSFLIFANTQVLEQFDIPEEVLRKFIDGVRQKYQDNPYHNYHHGVHVLQHTYLCLRRTSMHKYLCNVDILGILVSALCHDINHPGHSSDFEIKTDSKLSLLYNDVSVLENMHAHETFMLLRREELNIFAKLEVADRKELRKIIINAILATDMTNHKNFTTTLGEKLTVDEAFDVENSNARQFLVDVVVHAADISAQVYVWEVAQKWEERINREFVLQVEKERARGITPSSFMAELDQPMKRYKSQLFFCDIILKPFWKTLAILFPELEMCVRQLETNRSNYQEVLNKHIPPEVRDENVKEEVKVIVAPLRKKRKRKPRMVRSSSLDKLWAMVGLKGEEISDCPLTPAKKITRSLTNIPNTC